MTELLGDATSPLYQPFNQILSKFPQNCPRTELFVQLACRATSLRLPPLVQTLLATLTEASQGQIFSFASCPYGMSPLHIAASHNDENLISLIVRASGLASNPNLLPVLCHPDQYGRAPQHIAQLNRFSSLFEKLSTTCPNDLVEFQQAASIETQPQLDQESRCEQISEDDGAKGNGGWVKAMGETCTSCDLATIDAKLLNADVFVREFVSIGRPVRIRNFAKQWAITQYFHKNRLRARVGDVDVRGGKIPYGEVFGERGGWVSISEFLEYMDKPTAQDEEVLFGES
eukprot:c16875_g1_i3.p1 GENE.c16875_g1_i3~~c16875_g1_i3.p1  ORF type:complete len:287 (+),score=55.12 c16875_g1_i3:292-1152(+)